MRNEQFIPIILNYDWSNALKLVKTLLTACDQITWNYNINVTSMKHVQWLLHLLKLIRKLRMVSVNDFNVKVHMIKQLFMHS